MAYSPSAQNLLATLLVPRIQVKSHCCVNDTQSYVYTFPEKAWMLCNKLKLDLDKTGFIVNCNIMTSYSATQNQGNIIAHSESEIHGYTKYSIVLVGTIPKEYIDT